MTMIQETILSLYDKGLCIPTISDSVGCTERYVRQILKKNNGDYISSADKIIMYMEYNFDPLTNWLHNELQSQGDDPLLAFEMFEMLVNMPLIEGCAMTDTLLNYDIPRRKGHLAKSARLVKKNITQPWHTSNAMVISHSIYKYINRYRRLQGAGYDPLDIRLPF